MKNFIWNKRYNIVSFILLLVLWQILSIIVKNEVIVPAIPSTLKSIVNIIKDEKFLRVIFSTILRFFIGGIVTLVVALIIALVSYYYNFVYHILKPMVSFMRAVPTMGIVVLTLIWFSNNLAPIFIGFLVVFPIIYEGVLNALNNLDYKIISMAKLYKVKRIDQIIYIYGPHIINGLIPILPSALGLMMKVIIAGEVLGQPSYAIGTSLQMEKLYLNTSGVFSWIIIVVLINWIIELLIVVLYKGVSIWKEN